MAQNIKTTLALVGLSVLAIIAAELFARAIILIDDSLKDHEETRIDSSETRGNADKANLPAYETADYDVAQLFAELERDDRNSYKPYVVWSRRPFNGNLINIDAEGNRVTLNNSNREDALKVWMLGGSSAFGTGAPDGRTIPSHLANLLNEWGVDTQVRNLGQPAYVSTQEVIYLLRQLQDGQRPDLVILYDGANDAAQRALWPAVPGAHWDYQRIRSRFEGTDQNEPSAPAVTLARSTGLFRIARFVAARIGVKPVQRKSAPKSGASQKPQTFQIAEQVAEILLANYKIVAALGKEFRFVPFFMYQPALGVGEKPLDSSEQEILSQVMKYPGQGPGLPLNRELRTIIRQRMGEEDAPKYIYDTSDTFSDVTEPLYIDWVHITGKGNRIVAERIFQILSNELCSEPPDNISDHTKSQLALACG